MTRALLLAVSVGLTLLAAEAAVRLFGLQFATYHPISGFCQNDDELGWRLIPGRAGTFKGRSFEVLVEQSEQGLRDRHYPVEREPSRRRIVVLGDSIVWCWGVEMDDCFTELLERSLRETDVIAAGVPMYGTTQELLFYKRDLARFRPDLVLLVFVLNDLKDNVDTRYRPVYRLRDGDLLLQNVPVPRRKNAVKERLLARSMLFRQLHFATQVVRLKLKMAREGTLPDHDLEFVPVSREDEARARALTAALVARLDEVVAASGARLAIANTAAGERVGAWLASVAREHGIPYIDLVPALERGAAEGRSMRLPLDPHFAPDAHAIVAGAIREFIDDEKLLGGRAAPRARGAHERRLP